jgi:hypothetical protein
MKIIRSHCMALLGFCLHSALVAAGPTASGHGHASHAHGQGQMELVVQGSDVQVRFEIPMESLLGHEHLPRTKAQKQALAALQESVKQGSDFIQLPADAACQLNESKAASAMFKGQMSEHSDLDLSLTFSCAKPAALTQVELAVFSKYPRLSTLKVDMLTPKGQGSATLKAKNPVLRW